MFTINNPRRTGSKAIPLAQRLAAVVPAGINPLAVQSTYDPKKGGRHAAVN